MFTTRKECVAFLVSKGMIDALAKVAINECFNQIPLPKEEEDGLCRICTGPETSQIVVVPEETALEAYNEVIGSDVEIKHDGIYVLDELKYNLEGEIIEVQAPPVELTLAQNSPSTETVQ